MQRIRNFQEGDLVTYSAGGDGKPTPGYATGTVVPWRKHSRLTRGGGLYPPNAAKPDDLVVQWPTERLGAEIMGPFLFDSQLALVKSHLSLMAQLQQKQRLRCTVPVVNATSRAPKEVYYVAHPVSGDPIGNAFKTINWIKHFTKRFPQYVFVAPWVAEVLAFANENSDKTFYDRVLEDDCHVVRRLDGIVLVGGRISDGMGRELKAAREAGKKVFDHHGAVTPMDHEMRGYSFSSTPVGF